MQSRNCRQTTLPQLDAGQRVRAPRIFDHGVIYEDPETFGEFQLSYRTGDIVSPKLDAAEPLAIESAGFVSVVRAGRPDGVHLGLAANVVAMIEAANRSLEPGGRAFPVETSAATGSRRF